MNSPQMHLSPLLALAAAMGAQSTQATDPMVMTIKPSSSTFSPPRRRRAVRVRHWRPFGERHPDADFTPVDQSRIEKAEAKRARKALSRKAQFRVPSTGEGE